MTICINDLNPTKSNYPLKSEQCAISKRGGRIDQTTEDYYYEYEGIRIFIPKGFLWDGASIPRVLWPIMGGPFGRYGFAAMVHDMCYASRMVPRDIADKVFRQIMLDHGVSKFKAWLMYKSVSSFGNKAFYGTDERPAINRLFGWGHKYNPYKCYQKTLFRQYSNDQLFGFDESPWITMDDTEFSKAYTDLMVGKWHM